MEQMLICLSLALIAGLLMSRAAKAVRLPAVTAYLLTRSEEHTSELQSR